MHEVAFLFDVDNTLIDNDRAVADFHEELDGLVGAEIAKGYWALFELVRREVGHADYLEALQRFRMTHPRLPQLLELSKYLLRYPFANRLFPRSLDVVAHVGKRGPVALLSDGDAVFQPWKVWTSGLYEAVKGRVLIYQAKETCLADVEARLPAKHYVLFDDKLRIHAAVKAIWGERVTTVFLRQGHYAVDPALLAAHPPADLAFDRIDEVASIGVDELVAAGRAKKA